MAACLMHEHVSHKLCFLIWFSATVQFLLHPTYLTGCVTSSFLDLDSKQFWYMMHRYRLALTAKQNVKK